MAEPIAPTLLLSLLKPCQAEMIAMLRKVVLAESPSLDKAAADRCCTLLGAEWRKHGVRVERIAQKRHGDHLRITWWPHRSRAAGQLLVLGHYDTVYARGTLEKMPFRTKAGKAYGPGIFDMKAGIVQALFALQALQQSRATLRKRIVFLWTSDEEIGSPSSRTLIEAEARRSSAVFVMEPALGPWGLIKTSRKAVGQADFIVRGRASHAGLAPEEGINAIHELAHQLTRIQQWEELRHGVSINAGIIEGGTRSNVIPERAHAVLDLRALRTAQVQRVELRLRELRPFFSGARLEIRGGFDRPPLERKMSAALFAEAKALAAQMGFPLGECVSGGASDGNFTAALGVPTLDGLGAIGDGAHSAQEHIVIKAMPERAALLAALLATI
jgi:glutamate carboxypeptidase